MLREPMIDLRKIATVTCHDEHGFTVYWNDKTRQVSILVSEDLLDENTNDWFTMPDMNISSSLSFYLNALPSQVHFSNIFLFRKNHGKAADEQLEREIYDCDWSDFACENMYLEFDIRRTVPRRYPY